MKDCLFCKIINGKEKSYTIYEDSKAKVFLDIFPATKGHMLIIPKKHYQDISEVPDYLVRDLFSLAKKIGSCIGEFNIIQSNGKNAQQEIPHFHIHLIPRSVGDGVIFDYKTKKFDFAKLQKEFKTRLKSLQ